MRISEYFKKYIYFCKSDNEKIKHQSVKKYILTILDMHTSSHKVLNSHSLIVNFRDYRGLI